MTQNVSVIHFDSYNDKTDNPNLIYIKTEQNSVDNTNLCRYCFFFYTFSGLVDENNIIEQQQS